MDLQGRVALVTGGAHRVGGAIALALAEAGCRLIIHYRGSETQAEAMAAQIAGLGGQAELIQADLAELDALKAMAEQITSDQSRLDILVNSAASFRKQRLAAVQAKDWEESMAVNLRAPFFLTQALAPLIASTARPGGAPGLVVNIADLSALHPWKSYIQHGVSKAGLLHLSAILARELAPGIRVNAIVPGAILPPPGQDPDGELWDRMSSANPLGHAGDPSQIGAAVRFLAESDFITGAQIRVDGGEALLGPVNH